MEKSKIEKHLELSYYGPPEIKKEEKKRFLGNFRERILKVLLKEQVQEKGTYKEILDAIKDKRAKRMVVTNDVKMHEAMEYINMARRNNLEFTIVSADDFSGEIGLVIVSNSAIDEKDIFV